MKYSKNTQDFIKKFYEIPNNKDISPELFEFYTKNCSNFIDNANAIVDTYPEKCAIFWSELIKSNLILTIVNYVNTIYSSKKEIVDIQEGLNIIKSCFELSYELFSFFTFCDKGISKEMNPLWYKPNKAKEFSKDNSWKINKEPVSGKLWIIHNCSLFKFANFDIDLLKHLKNSASHEKLIIVNNEAHIIKNGKNIKINFDEIIACASYIKGCINLVFHFYGCILIKHNLWMFISLFISSEAKYNKIKIPFEILKKSNLKTNKVGGRSKQAINLGLRSVSEIVILYLLNKIWDDFITESPRLNRRFQFKSMKFNSDLIPILKKQSIYDTYNAIGLTIYKLNQLSLGIKEDYLEADPINHPELDFRAQIRNFHSTVKKIQNLKGKEESMGLAVFMLIGFMLIVIGPLKHLQDNFNKLLINSDNATDVQ